MAVLWHYNPRITYSKQKYKKTGQHVNFGETIIDCEDNFVWFREGMDSGIMII